MLWLMVAIGVIGLVLGGAFRAPALLLATAASIVGSIAVCASSGMTAAQTAGWALCAFAVLNAGYFCAASIRLWPLRARDRRISSALRVDAGAAPRQPEVASK